MSKYFGTLLFLCKLSYQPAYIIGIAAIEMPLSGSSTVILSRVISNVYILLCDDDAYLPNDTSDTI